MAVTQIAAGTAAVAWMLAEWTSHGKPSAFGIVSGAVGRLVAMTPAFGSVGPMNPLAIGAAAGVGCFDAATKLKRTMADRDLLDVFGVHAAGGIVGEMLTGVFCLQRFDGMGVAGENASMGAQVTAQLMGVVATIVNTAMVSHII